MSLQEFENTVVAIRPRLHRVAMRWLSNREDAEDAVQATFLQAFTHLHQFEHRSSLSTWMQTILMRILQMNFRRTRRVRFQSLDATPEDAPLSFVDLIEDGKPTPEQSAVRADLCQRIERTLAMLPAAQQTVIRLYYGQDLKVCEVADQLDRLEGTVKAQLARGKHFLRKKLA
jgi:RNA polymerase sigma-70 factor (ECF subfamily)